MIILSWALMGAKGLTDVAY